MTEHYSHEAPRHVTVNCVNGFLQMDLNTNHTCKHWIV